jgi:ankyrin repeat protein
MKTWIATLFTAGALLWSNLAHGGEIHAAAMRGDVEKVKALLAADPDLVSSKDEHGWTPLYFAAGSGHKDVVELLLANKADVNALNQNFTPLRAAILNHHPDVADLLIASNAQVTIFDAAGGGYVNIVKAQLKADPALATATDDSGWTALHFAARNGHLDVAKLLLANKADVNVKTKIGMTPLEVAFAFSPSAMPFARTTDTNYEAIAELLIAHGAEVSSRSNVGLTALHYAASAGFTNVINELLDRHADVNAKDNSGRTPLDLAAQHGRLDVVDLLVARGAEMDAKDRAGLMALKDAEKSVQTPSSSGREYEVDGLVNQTMIQFNGTNLHASASFTVYVRDCGWMIKTVETNELGGVVAREIGSTNGTEIFECTSGLGGFWPTSGQIESSSVPVGQLDSAVVGHLWLMFASQCYWPGLNSDQLVPVYDWHASVAAGGQDRRVSADWELLNGSGSLPREVRYLDVLNHTNAIYTITGTNSAGGMSFPAGFVFKQFNGDRLIKHVEVEVTAIRPFCSRANLIPLPSKGTMVVDRRFDSGVPNRPPSYQNPVFGRWLTVEESQKLAGINKANDLRNLARMGISPFPQTQSILPETPTSAPVLSLSIRCTNGVVKAGDEIDIEFRITNTGTNNYKYPNRTYDRSGRMPEYKLVATNSSGEVVPDVFKVGGFGGGGFQYAILKPGESFTKIIPLNDWALIKEPGRYDVTGTYYAEVVSNNPAVNSGLFISSIPIAPALTAVNVLPRTEAEMDAYISDLTNQIASLTPKQIFPYGPYSPGSTGPTPAMDGLLKKLTYTCNPKIVPTMLDTLYLSGHGGFWESQALLAYVPRTEAIGKAIIAAAIARGLAPNMEYIISEYGFTNKTEIKPLIERALAPDNEEGWASGAELAEKYSDDDFTPRLIAIAMTPRSNARNSAITALAYNRTDEGVKTLKTLLNDPHEEIWTTLADAIMNAYNWKDKPAGTPLRPDDFTAQDMKPLIERMLTAGRQSPDVITAVSLLEQFGSDNFTPQLIAIATDSRNIAWQSAVYALAFNRTDDGVKTLKSLLNSSNPEVRKAAGNAIRAAYTDRSHVRGRPLQPEDFDKEYQRPKTEK